MTTKTATLKAWLPSHSSMRPCDVRGTDPLTLANECGFSSLDMATSGWVCIGEATISVELAPVERMTSDTIAALRRQQGELQAKATQIEGEIQKLLAITYAPVRDAEEVVL